MRQPMMFAVALAVSSACAHAERVPVEVERIGSDGEYEEWAKVSPRPGGFVADVQFRVYGHLYGPVRVKAVKLDADTIELRIDYRSSRAKCLGAEGYRVTVHGLAPGSYEFVMTRQGSEIAKSVVVVSEPAGDEAGALVKHMAGGGC